MPVLFARVTSLAVTLCLLLVPVAGLAQPLAIALDTLITYNCTTQQPGSLFMTTTGGTPPYQYLWSNGDTTEDITGLVSGSYSVTVTDAAGATASWYSPHHIDFQVDVVFTGFCPGIVGIFMEGGTAPYSIGGQYYNNHGFFSVYQQDISTNGYYSITVTDANGCISTDQVNFAVPQPPVVGVQVTNTPCEGQSKGEIAFSISGGNPPYFFIDFKGIGNNSRDTSFLFVSNGNIKNLPSGNYNIFVQDNAQCTTSVNYQVNSLNPNPVATFTPISVNGSVVSFTPVNPVPGTYTWDFGDPASGAANTSTLQQPNHGFFQAGTYETRLKMTSIHGCTDSTKQTVTVNGTVQGRVHKGVNPSVPADSARVWLLRQSIPGGPFAVVDSQDVSTSNYIFSFPVNFSYQDSLTLYAALLPQDLGFGQWEPAYYGNTALLATATRVQTTSLTSLANIFLSTKVPVEPAAGALAATLSPNPFVNTLEVRLLASLSGWTATLYAADGRQVLAHACTGEHATLNVAHLPAGVYLLRVSGGGKEAAFRVMKEE